MSTADPFLPEQRDPSEGESAAVDRAEQGVAVDPPVADVVEESLRAEHPDPEGDAAADDGLPPMTDTSFPTPSGQSVDPAADATS